MAFVVRAGDEGDIYRAFSDEDNVEVIPGGVLKIALADGTFRYISASMWSSIDETPASPVNGQAASFQSGQDGFTKKPR